jgi:hypothetical protein
VSFHGKKDLVPGTFFLDKKLSGNLVPGTAQGIEAVSFFACGKKDTSG